MVWAGFCIGNGSVGLVLHRQRQCRARWPLQRGTRAYGFNLRPKPRGGHFRCRPSASQPAVGADVPGLADARRAHLVLERPAERDQISAPGMSRNRSVRANRCDGPAHAGTSQEVDSSQSLGCPKTGRAERIGAADSHMLGHLTTEAAAGLAPDGGCLGTGNGPQRPQCRLDAQSHVGPVRPLEPRWADVTARAPRGRSCPWRCRRRRDRWRSPS